MGEIVLWRPDEESPSVMFTVGNSPRVVSRRQFRQYGRLDNACGMNYRPPCESVGARNFRCCTRVEESRPVGRLARFEIGLAEEREGNKMMTMTRNTQSTRRPLGSAAASIDELLLPQHLIAGEEEEEFEDDDGDDDDLDDFEDDFEDDDLEDDFEDDDLEDDDLEDDDFDDDEDDDDDDFEDDDFEEDEEEF